MYGCMDVGEECRRGETESEIPQSVNNPTTDRTEQKARTSLDRVDRRIGERAHRARDEADEHVLVRRQVGQLGLHPVRELLQLLVRREVRTWK